MFKDGLYVDDPQILQKYTSINIQKLEERLLREGKINFFHPNGEIQLHNDLLADQITKPENQAFETSKAFQTREINSILCNRLHSFKKKYYKMDISIGKLIFKKIANMFTEEDKLTQKLKELK